MGLLDEAIREHLELKRRRGADPTEVDRLEREALGPVRRSPHDAPDVLLGEEDPLGGAYPAEDDVEFGVEELPDWADPRDEPATFEHEFEPAGEAPPAGQWEEIEPPTQIAPLPDQEQFDPRERTSDLPRHHEIAEEWEAHERQGIVSEPSGFEPDELAPAPPVPPASDSAYTPPPGDAPGPVFGGERQRQAPPEGYDLDQETMEHDVEAEELGEPNHAESREGEDVLEETPDFLQDTPDHDRLWFEQRPPRDFDFDG